MRELLIKMSDVSAEQFASRLTDLQSRECDLAPLWQLMEARRTDSSNQWKDWLDGNGDMPESPQRKQHVSTMEEPDGLPELTDALETLDQELGFLD